MISDISRLNFYDIFPRGNKLIELSDLHGFEKYAVEASFILVIGNKNKSQFVRNNNKRILKISHIKRTFSSGKYNMTNEDINILSHQITTKINLNKISPTIYDFQVVECCDELYSITVMEKYDLTLEEYLDNTENYRKKCNAVKNALHMMNKCFILSSIYHKNIKLSHFVININDLSVRMIDFDYCSVKIDCDHNIDAFITSAFKLLLCDDMEKYHSVFSHIFSTTIGLSMREIVLQIINKSPVWMYQVFNSFFHSSDSSIFCSCHQIYNYEDLQQRIIDTFPSYLKF